MHYYRERNLVEAILEGAPVKFDREIDVSYSISPTTLEEEPDFLYDEAGYIDFRVKGFYIVKWSTISMTGFSSDAAWFELKYYDETEGEWYPLGIKGTSSLIPIHSASNSGYIPLDIREADLDNGNNRYRIALFNVSGNSVSLSRFPIVKASLVIFGVLDYGEAVTGLMELIDTYEEDCCQKTMKTDIEEREMINFGEGGQNDVIEYLKELRDLFWKEFTWYYEPDPEGAEGNKTYPVENFPGLYINVLRVGYTYTFILSGQKTTQTTTEIGSKNNLLTSEQFPPLKHYNGEFPTVVPCIWVRKDELKGYFPVKISKDGIYFEGQLPSFAPSADIYWDFYQMLVLVPGNAWDTSAVETDLP